MNASHLFLSSLRVSLVALLVVSQALSGTELSPRTAPLDLLIQKARSLEARDRADLAAQVWQQVLLSSPNQPDALAGLARWAKRSGKNDEANSYLSRLRKVSPDAPALTQLDGPEVAHKGSARLDEAGKLAANGHAAEAMEIYREVFGSTPPIGGWAIAYYETMANTPGGFDPAVSALRKLAESYPDVPGYQVAAARLMTYRPATRMAGVNLLAAVSGSTAAAGKARDAWRQALVWEKANPAYAASFDAYLNRYPDADLQAFRSVLRTQAAKSEPQSMEARESQLGYQALKSGNASDAEHEFTAAIAKDDKNARAHAGLGFVRMKANDFDGAVQQFEAAQKLNPNDASVRNSLDAARFWRAMRLGAKATDAGDWAQAVVHYQAALVLRPNSEEATRALGGAFLAAGLPGKAIPYLASAAWGKNFDAATWCALVRAKLEAEGGKAALATMQSAPATAAATLKQSVAWRALEASAYLEIGDSPRADKIYRDLIISGPSNLTVAEQVQMASLALHFHQPSEALPFARKALEANENDPGAWEVLLPALVGAGRPQEADRVNARMPANVRAVLMTRASFLEASASLKEVNGDLEGARALLEQSAASQGSLTSDAARVATKLHLAQVLAKLGRGAEAQTAASAMLDAHPEDVDVWRANFQILQTLGLQNEIVANAARMPQAVAIRLGTEGDMVTLLAHAHGAAGNPAFGIRLLETYISRSHASDPSDCISQRIQLGWLLLDSPAESSRLYAILDGLNGRRDLTGDQRREVTSLWSTWIVRSAEAARRKGDGARALGLLEQGLNMFPDNVDLQRALAGDLLAAGKTKRAFNVYCNWGLAGAQATDYAGAIGAALAERNAQYADNWIDRGLAQWPGDPKLLELAGERAKDRGDLKKAELYWKEALTQKKLHPDVTSVAAAEDAGQAPLRTLLVGADDARSASKSDAGFESQATTRVHLSSFGGAGAAREDFVRSNAFLPEGMGVAASTRSSLLVSPLVAGAVPADTLEDKIAALESRNTPYLGSRMSVWGRGGQPGFDRLLIEQAEIEASTTLSNAVRASLLIKPTYLSGGIANGSGNALFGRQAAPGSFGSQDASGIAAEAQLSSQSFGLRAGTTPQGFLTHTWIGGLRIQPANGPITILLERDSVKDTMLSFAGARDPQSSQTWGGVMANSATIQGHWGDTRSGLYAGGGYQMLDGRNVARNTGFNGNFGSWWKVAELPTGSLTLGMNFSAMHYDRNLRYFSFGQGGYFSPQQYFLFNVPVRWTGTYGHRLQYVIGGSFGVQHFVEDASDYYPTDALLQARTNEHYAGLTVTGANFNFDTRVNYQLAPHWILGAFATASNARNYTSSSAGLFVKYTFEERPMSFDNALPSLPDWRGQQPFQLY